MITTPAPELPDLDRLEALARAAAEHGDNIGEDDWYSADESMAIFGGNPDLALVAACSPVAVLQLIALARRPPVPAARPTDDELWDSTLRDRDNNQEWADKLAGAIAIHFGVDIGEHSNANCPWHEALEVIESAEPARRAQPEGEAIPGKQAVFSINLLGGPMREYAPGKWESAVWPSDKPEGEAPQAELAEGDTVKVRPGCRAGANEDFSGRVGVVVGFDAEGMTGVEVDFPDGASLFCTAAELERAPAAQHAESRAQAPEIERWDDRLTEEGYFYKGEFVLTGWAANVAARDAEIAELRAALVAQSQGAQAASIDGLPRYKLVPGDQREWMVPAADGAWCRFDHAAALAAKAEAPNVFLDSAETVDAWCAVQQAAAPGAEPGPWQVLTDDTEINGTRRLDVVLTNGVQENGRWYNQIDWTQVADWRYSRQPDAAPSAPGTPEAPAEWLIEFDGELRIKQAGRTGIVPNPNSESHAERVLYALGRAIAAQLDGGQTGGVGETSIS